MYFSGFCSISHYFCSKNRQNTGPVAHFSPITSQKYVFLPTLQPNIGIEQCLLDIYHYVPLLDTVSFRPEHM